MRFEKKQKTITEFNVNFIIKNKNVKFPYPHKDENMGIFIM